MQLTVTSEQSTPEVAKLTVTGLHGQIKPSRNNNTATAQQYNRAEQCKKIRKRNDTSRSRPSVATSAAAASSDFHFPFLFFLPCPVMLLEYPDETAHGRTIRLAGIATIRYS